MQITYIAIEKVTPIDYNERGYKPNLMVFKENEYDDYSIYALTLILGTFHLYLPILFDKHLEIIECTFSKIALNSNEMRNKK